MITTKKLNWFQRWQLKRKWKRVYKSVEASGTLFGYPIIEHELTIDENTGVPVILGTLKEYDKQEEQP